MNYIYDPSKGLILAIIPFYEEDGNAHKIFYENGSWEVSTNRFIYIMNQYLKYWNLEFRTLISKSKNTNNTGTKPIPVTLNHTFIPIRARKSRLEGDKVYGLFWHEKIKYPENTSREQFNTLSCGGFEFEVYCSYNLLQQKRKEAKELQLEWKKRHGQLTKQQVSFNKLYTGVNMVQTAFEEIKSADYCAEGDDTGC